MTVADLLTDPTFLALCGYWRENYRAPLVLPDFLREQGLWEEALRAEWAVEFRDRRDYETQQPKGPTPRHFQSREGMRWVWYTSMGRALWADDWPPGTTPEDWDPHHGWQDPLICDTFPEAVVAFLTHFRVPEAVTC